MKLSLPQKNGANLSFTPPPLKANVLFCRFCLGSHPVLDQTQGFGALFSWLYEKLYYLQKLHTHTNTHEVKNFKQANTKYNL